LIAARLKVNVFELSLNFIRFATEVSG
jgi:hypothetical protein